jgi:hypothetical protein
MWNIVYIKSLQVELCGHLFTRSPAGYLKINWIIICHNQSGFSQDIEVRAGWISIRPY